MRVDLPTGTVTFLFTDIEGSTRLLHELGAATYAAALLEHRQIVRAAAREHGGVEVDNQGDAFFLAFPTAPGAVRAAGRIVEDLAAGRIRLRMGLHTGAPYVTDEGYVGDDVHRAARIAACGHGGQVLVSSATAALLPPGEVSLLDLGEHRLKDLSAPERLHQLGNAGYPPLRSLHRTNLPVPPTPFLGRGQELAELTALLARRDVRLLTLTGPGGTGKTRLALQAAAAVSDAHPGGVFWVPLAALRDPTVVLDSAAAAMGGSDGLVAAVGEQEVLLVLDNMEHLTAAATDLVDLVAACPRLRLVVTSRETLRVPGEQVFPVPPLASTEAVELFVSRARATDPHVAVSGPAVPALCRRLDDLPLAIELAAARMRMLTADQLLARLSDRLDLLRAGTGVADRQRTLRATVEWSLDLLDADESALFARLAVFAGGWSLEAAEEVCDADLAVLESLVDKSLVRVRDGGRFSMLETIREVAVERLAATPDEAALRRRHAETYLRLAEETQPLLRGPGAAQWLARLDIDHDNLRAAAATLAATSRVDERLALATCLVEYWQNRGFLVEGARHLADALASGGGDASRARALDGAAALASAAGDTVGARRYAEQALALHDRLDDDEGRAAALWTLGYVAVEEGDWAFARHALERSVTLFGDIGAELDLIGATRTLAFLHDARGDRAQARLLHEANLARARERGDLAMLAEVLGSLATLAVAENRLDEALPMLCENQDLLEQVGDEPGLLTNLGRIARLLAGLGQPTAALELLACSEAARGSLGGLASWAERMNQQTRESVTSALQPAARRAAEHRGAARPVREAAHAGLEQAAASLAAPEPDSGAP